jgi:hydroxymethylpyrimidine/phosphomethylpyrimidine kinase
MPKRTEVPTVLTIAGSDSGGGAGIQADLKTFAALGVHGTTVVTCVTAQNPTRVVGIHPCPAEVVRWQLEAVFEAFRPRAVKIGMLFSAGIIKEILKFLRQHRMGPFIVDPLIVATSGARLIEPDAFDWLRREILPRAALITPNLPEAEMLTGLSIHEPEGLRAAARRLHHDFGCAVLVKGGHFKGTTEAVDIFQDGETELLLRAPFIKGVSTHGTGCTYSAAIAAYCALGHDLAHAVARAKEFITQAIARSTRSGGHDLLNPFWQPRR